MKRILTAAVLLAATGLSAQTVTVSASNLKDGNSAANGTIYFAPVLTNGQKASYVRPGGGIATVTALHATVTAGAFTLTMPDASLTNPQWMCFSATLNTSNGSVLGPGYSCVQPHGTSLSGGDWCATGACNFDNLAPNLPAQMPVVTGPAGPAGASGTNCASGSSPATCVFNGTLKVQSSDGSQSQIVGVGGENFNVKAYGAYGDATHDDAAAIGAAVSALNAAGGGKLYFPRGNYQASSCGFTLSAPAVVYGDGQKAVDSSSVASVLGCPAGANAFNVTSDLFVAHDLGLSGPTTGSPTNSGFYLNTGTVHGRYNIYSVSVNGFRDAIYVNAGAYWSIRDTHIINPVRYGVDINNVLNNDEGDWRIDNLSCVGGSQTNTSTTAGSSACIAQFSSGGGKISSIKSNTSYTHGYYGNLTGSQQTLIDQADIENVTNSPIYFANGWPNIVITGSYLNSPAGYPAIYVHGGNGLYIGGNVLQTSSGGANPASVVLDAVYNGVIGANHWNDYFTGSATITGNDGSVADLSGLGKLSSSLPTIQSFTIGGLFDPSTLYLPVRNGGVTYSSSIQTAFGGNGMTFTVPRDLVGKGYYFNGHDGTTRLYVESNTGKITSTNQTLDDGSGNAKFGSSGAGMTLTLGPTTANGDATIVFNSTNSSTLFTGSFLSSWSGAGMTWKLPRTLAGKGYHFQDASGTDLLYIDSVTGGTAIARGSLALATSAIASGACQAVTAGSVNSAAATGVATTDTISFTPNGSIKAVTGYAPTVGGGLVITAYPTAGFVNFDVCNWSSGSITPGAVTLNWKVAR